MGEIATIDFILVDKPIRDLVTKFGGQPVWYSEPDWPMSRESGKPMQFICQIKLEERLFGETLGRMAYVFMGSFQDGDNTADPEEGGNAIIIQPGNPEVLCEPVANGPTLFYTERRHEQKKAWIGVRDEYFDVEVPCEFAAELTYQQEMDSDEFARLREIRGDQYYEAAVRMERNKLGGAPIFVQSNDWPFGAPTPLLLQLNHYGLPFDLDLGGDGAERLYALISNDGSVGRVFWQCT